MPTGRSPTSKMTVYASKKVLNRRSIQESSCKLRRVLREELKDWYAPERVYRVRWHITYRLSYRDRAAMMAERGLDHRIRRSYGGSFGACPSSRSGGTAMHVASGPLGGSTNHASVFRVNGITSIVQWINRERPWTFCCDRIEALPRRKLSSGMH